MRDRRDRRGKRVREGRVCVRERRESERKRGEKERCESVVCTDIRCSGL